MLYEVSRHKRWGSSVGFSVFTYCPYVSTLGQPSELLFPRDGSFPPEGSVFSRKHSQVEQPSMRGESGSGTPIWRGRVHFRMDLVIERRTISSSVYPSLGSFL
jgi:hypothetical protein